LEGCRQLTLRVTRLALPMPAPVIRPREIGAIRAQLRVSQPVFARLLNVPVATARSWEQGKRTPSGAALRLLDIARRNPEVLVASP
jgi:putative transcriptional regulator